MSESDSHQVLREVDQDLARGALDEAHARLEAVDRSDWSPSDLIAWSIRTAEVHLLGGSLDAARAHALEAQKQARTHDRITDTVIAGSLVALVGLRRADAAGRAEAQTVLDDLAAHRGHIAGDALARLEQASAVLALRQDRLDEARRACFAGIDAAVLQGDTWREAQLHDVLSSVHVRFGDPLRALAQVERAIDLKRAGADRVGLAISLGNRGRHHMRHGQSEAALSDFEESLALAREAGDTLGVVVAQDMCGLALMKLGRWAASRDALRTAARGVMGTGHDRHLALCLKDRAVLEETCGGLRAARRWAVCSRRAFQRAGVADGAGYAAHAIARISHKMGAPDTLDWATTAVTELADAPRPDLYCEALLLQSRLLQEIGETARAQAIAARAAEIAAQRGLGEIARQIRQEAGARDANTLIIRDEVGLGATEFELFLIEELETGGQGRAWRARDSATHRQLVVKERKLSIDNEKRTRELGWWRRELAAAAAVDHPNVVRIHGMHRDSRRIHLVMEYLDGGSLWDRLNAAPPPIEVGLSWIAKLAAGLEAIHATGVLHRDPSLGNVVFRGDEPVWIDLGLALLPHESREGSPVGTPGFVPPEVLVEQGFSEASDVYGLGALAVAILTGRGPYHWADRTDSLHVLLRVARDRDIHGQMVASDVPWPADLPTEIRDILGQALSYEPNERPTAGDLVRTMRAAIAPPAGPENRSA